MKELLTSLVAVIAISGAQAQSMATSPKLVIELTIDQLRTDYIERFSPLFGPNGFKRLWRDGQVYTEIEFPFARPDMSSAAAAISTGTVPRINGIVATSWLNRKTLNPVNCVNDPAFMGVYTDETVSASQLLTSTVTDELKIATQGKAIVYSFSPFSETAVLSAGHAADGAFWLNPSNGKWCGSTYYGDFPRWLSQYNDQEGIDFRIDKMVWEPTYPISMYKYLSSDWVDTSFSHKFSRFKYQKYSKLTTSPLINDEINKVVKTCLDRSTIGYDAVTDFLSISYYGGNFDHKTVKEAPYELQDTYVRLDKSIENLLNIVDRKVGLKNVLFVVVSNGYTDPDSFDSNAYRIPRGEFYMNRSAALLNMYLMALYGEGKYVDGYLGQQIYLDHTLIQKKQLLLSEVLDQSANFLVDVSGVQEVYSSHRLLLGSWNPQIRLERNLYHPLRSGDLTMKILPGWMIMQEKPLSSQLVRSAYFSAPLIFLGNAVAPTIIRTPIQVERLAATLSQVLRIRPPNACSAMSLPIQYLKKK
ncbi:MAG: alkaline phosphatase family protein [Bacteroidaceae bacterium]|nr:alkaline phosphatase family protein [Bacteroidaceae bacterium]